MNENYEPTSVVQPPSVQPANTDIRFSDSIFLRKSSTLTYIFNSMRVVNEAGYAAYVNCCSWTRSIVYIEYRSKGIYVRSTQSVRHVQA